MIFIHICFASLVFFCLYTYFKYKKNCDLINRIPGPKTHPIIGNYWLLNAYPERLWNVFRYVNNNYYPIARYWFGLVPFVIIRHPHDLQIILSSSKHIDKGSAYKCFHPWMKNGLLTSSSDTWHHRRKILTPAFQFQMFEKYLHIFDNNSKKFVETLIKENIEIVQDLTPLCANYTLNSICESTMGVSLDKIDNDAVEKYKKAIHTIREIILQYRILRPFIQDWMLNFSSKITCMQKSALKTLHEFSCMILEQRKLIYKNFNNDSQINVSHGVNGTNSEKSQTDKKMSIENKLVMLDLLLKAESDRLIDTEGIKEELNTVIFAGHDTTTMALVFIIMLLSEHQEIQEKAREEVVSVFNKHKSDLNLKIQELHYVERCIKESLRLYPPVHSITRRLQENVQLNAFVVPAGTEVVCNIFDVHRDPNFWPRPTKYNPDRFLLENIQKRHPYAYIPFSAGPRNCLVGQQFVMMELKCLIAHILFNFKLEPVTKISDVKLTMDMITRPSTPVYTKFVKIK